MSRPCFSANPAGDWELGQTCRVVLAAGLAMGIGAGLLAAALTSATPGIFTSDAALHPTMRSLAPKVSRSPANPTNEHTWCTW